MPAYKMLPEVISEICKILVSGVKSNELALREFIKAQIKKELSEKSLGPDEFEKELAERLADRLYAYTRVSRIDAPFAHSIDYARSIYQDVDTAVEVYAESCAALRLTPELRKELEEQILASTADTENKKLWDFESLDELAGILLSRINQKRMSLYSAVKTYYIKINKPEFALEYYVAQIQLLSAEMRMKLDETFPAAPTVDDLYMLHQFFCDVVEEQYVEKFAEEIRQEMQVITQVPTIHQHWQYLYFQDDCFPLYCANWVKGSNFIAMSGAKDYADLATSMHSLLFSANMQAKPPVTTIIALGNCTAQSSERIDFVNSYYDDRDPACNDMTSGKVVTVSTRASDGKPANPEHDFNYQITIQNTYVSDSYLSSAGFITSELDVSGKKLNALLIGLPDGDSLDLAIESPEIEQLKELFWQISQKSATEAVAVHCAAGVGRTGHIILMLEILKNYQRLFASDNSPEIIAQKISAIVNRIRETRPALVYAPEQYLMAVKNADMMYQYALNKKYITEPALLSSLSFLAPALPAERKVKTNALDLRDLETTLSFRSAV